MLKRFTIPTHSSVTVHRQFIHSLFDWWDQDLQRTGISSTYISAPSTAVSPPTANTRDRPVSVSSVYSDRTLAIESGIH